MAAMPWSYHEEYESPSSYLVIAWSLILALAVNSGSAYGLWFVHLWDDEKVTRPRNRKIEEQMQRSGFEEFWSILRLFKSYFYHLWRIFELLVEHEVAVVGVHFRVLVALMQILLLNFFWSVVAPGSWRYCFSWCYYKSFFILCIYRTGWMISKHLVSVSTEWECLVNGLEKSGNAASGTPPSGCAWKFVCCGNTENVAG